MRTPTLLEIVSGLVGGATMAGLLALSTCSPEVAVLERVKTLGELRVATINSPTTYYIGVSGPTGFEYDLARGFADSLGVKLKILVEESPSAVIAAVQNGRAHLGAAGLAVTAGRQRQVQFTPAVRRVLPQLVYRQGLEKPAGFADLKGRLRVASGSSAAERLQSLRADHPSLDIAEEPDTDAEALLYQVAEGTLDYTVANSDLVAINRRYHPELRIGFAAADWQDLAWGLGRGDDSLLAAATEYLQTLGTAELTRMRDRYFGHVAHVNTLGAAALATHVRTRLPRFRKVFETAATKTGLDWRLLAAVGYQESHWDPDAVSYTGVRGLMQITSDTAAFLGIQDRLDPVQSIHGAARYLVKLKAQIPESVPEPDRTWMTLAAYNIGYGHLSDARKLTDLQGGDPDRWLDVRNALPLLTQFKWFSKTEYGYARGLEAMSYVGNVRGYYDVLVWISEGRGKPPPKLEEEPSVPAPKERQKPPLNIESPVL